MAKGMTSIWKTVLQIAVAVMLIIGGISVFTNGAKDELVKAVGNLFNAGTLRDVVVWVLAAIEIITGVLLILDFFHINSLDRLDDIFLLIIMIAWIVVFMVLGELIPLFKGHLAFVPFLQAFAKDAVMVAVFGIIKAKI
ncbi:MAG: hypothetical protein IAA81_02070 [Spirochaetes bacterium]|uniref:Uncharacterized protein n=1 Tax=Candidatus Gallitreponema excrementavium TaxID=2840840 RepID=A0A9D9HNM4_9SPIR|nr:hypothetical protein [Candidatus Gallitreponema excrementavium]